MEVSKTKITRWKICLLHLLVLVNFLYNEVEAQNCIPRKYSFDSTVCVCNSTYCDVTPKVRAPLPGNFILYTSSRDGLRFEKSLGTFKSKITATRATLRVNRNQTYQEFIGFGAAFTDSSGYNILSLSPAAQDLLLKSYFSSDGNEYTMGRVPIGGTDFSLRGYTYQDNDTDANLKSFNLTMEDYKYKIPLIKQAETITNRSLKLIASCWSPPAWMKTNRQLTGFGTLKEEYYRAYANYHVKFFDEYIKQDLKFWCVTTGNEPSSGISPINKINALGWTPVGQTKWIGQHFGPMMRSSYPNTCIMAIDDQRFSFPWWVTWIMKDKTASQYINGTGVHWYWDFVVSPTVLTTTHNLYPNLFILSTESSYGDKPWELDKVALGAWNRGEEYAQDMIISFNNWVTGWIDWNFALNEKGGPNWVNNFVDAAIIVNKTADEFYKQPMFYALGHFSKFILPGSVRINTSSSLLNPIEAVSVKRPDDSIAVILLNRRSFDVQLTFIDNDRGSALINVPKRSIISMIYR
ncbi:lysosomal acid glucosylceramidase-like isoform X2 [Planococcus citri]|uniref:lysosomal acid glucosylceramidase-like isoform X2 n=1 Tax=Planococcus citri TaxID=170843 RepID=UPI0031F97084